MEENENPYLLACMPLNPKFAHLKKILLTTADFKIGRSLTNSVCIPHLSISRNHCTFKKTGENEWLVEDHSTGGIKINGVVLGKGSKKKLEHEDLISLEHAGELFYKFVLPALDVFEIPRKRMRMAESPDCTIINDVKLKFEESQKCEIQHIEDKIQNAKQIQTTSIIHKQKLQDDMNRKIQQLENEFSVQIENLKGEKDEVERQKASLIEERDSQLAKVKEEMETKISELMEQISKQYESEAELLKENTLLKEKLEKEREDFLCELNRESSSKQDMLDKLEAKIREQEEVRLKERQELEDTLKRETEQLRLAKEEELEEMTKLKRQREKELEQELRSIKLNLAKQVEQTEQQRIRAEQELKQQIEEMNKLQAEEKAKRDQLQKEREDIQKKLTEAQNDAEKSKVEVQARVIERETELAALAAERIQKQVDQSSEVITTLQEQLEKVKSQLQVVETEKNTLLESISVDAPAEGASKEATLNEFGELMESELQCSICAELFVEATTLNCSHTFCKYCITMWKKKKKDCPICRSTITSECKSLVLDSFIERMVQNLTDEMKKKREDMLKYRAAEVRSSTARTSNSRKRRSSTIMTARRTTSTSLTTIHPSGSGTYSTRQRRTVDLTMLPIPMSPAMRPPVLPAQTVLRHPHQPSGQILSENLTTRRQVHIVDLTRSPTTQIPTGRVVVRQMSTDLRQIPTEDQTFSTIPTESSSAMTLRSQVQTIDLTTPPMSRAPTDSPQTLTDMRQIVTDPTENQATSYQLDLTTTPTMSRVPIDSRQTSTDMRHIVKDPTENQATSYQLDLTTTPMNRNPTGGRQTSTDPTDMSHIVTDQTENQATSYQIDLTTPPMSQMSVDDRQMSTDMLLLATDPTEDRQALTADGPTLSTNMNSTARPATQLRTHQQSYQILAESLMGPPMGIPTDDRQTATDMGQRATDPTGIRQAQIENLATRRQEHQMRTLTSQIAIDDRQMSTGLTTEVRQISTAGGPTLPMFTNPTQMRTQLGAHQQGRQMETQNLTMQRQVQTVDQRWIIQVRRTNVPNLSIQTDGPTHQQGRQMQRQTLTLAIPMRPGERPPTGANVRLLRMPTQQGQAETVILTLEGGVVTSQVSLVPTTAATGGASRAAPAATGPPAAPSDNQNPPSS